MALTSLLLNAPAVLAAPLSDPIDLRTVPPTQATVIQGAQGGDQIGSSLAGAGDWNDDGRPDLVIGSPFARDPLTGNRTGLAQVVFGVASPPATIDLASLGAAGTLIVGEADGDQLGFAVAGVGDWNGDSIDDLALGAPFAQPGGATETGRVYILFGRSSPPARIDLGSLAPSDGVVITGAAMGDQTGFALAAAGDWNDDGRPDLAMGAPNADFGATDAGRAYVLFGNSSPPATLSLASLASAEGTIIDGAHDSGTVPVINLFGDSAGFALTGGADFTGDGIDDLLVNAPGADSGAPDAGVTYLIEGSPTPPATIDLELPSGIVHTLVGAAAGDEAFLITTGTFNAFFGGSVASLGDLNGDGRDDFAIASQFADPGGDLSGEVYGLRGQSLFPASMSLGALPGGDATIRGEAAGDLTGRGLAGAGDINGDGFADLAIGAPEADPLGRSGAGIATVLFGAPVWSSVFALPDTQGFGIRILGDLGGDHTGLAVAGLGDWNGDGLNDLAVGSPDAGVSGRTGCGLVHVIFGGPFSVPLPTGVEAWPLYR